MMRLVRVLRALMEAAGGGDVVDAGVDAALWVSRRVSHRRGLRLGSTRMSLVSRLRRRAKR